LTGLLVLMVIRHVWIVPTWSVLPIGLMIADGRRADDRLVVLESGICPAQRSREGPGACLA